MNGDEVEKPEWPKLERPRAECGVIGEETSSPMSPSPPAESVWSAVSFPSGGRGRVPVNKWFVNILSVPDGLS